MVFCIGAGLGPKVTRHAPGISKMEPWVPNRAPQGPKWSPGGSKMESWRIQNEARRVPHGPSRGPARGPMPPQGPQRGSSAALSSPSRHQDASQGAQGRLVRGFASDFGPQKAPLGVPNRSKKWTKSVSKNVFISDRVLESNFLDFGVPKTSFLGHENGSKCI